MTAPVLPTPEALDAADRLCRAIQHPNDRKQVARAFDRFAAQRAAEAVPVSVRDPVRSLVNDIGGCWSAFEHALREVMGNANYASVAEKIEALRNVAATPPPGDASEQPTPLLPCPFCGSTNIDPREWLRGDGVAGPGCSDCGATAQATAEWNRRIVAQCVEERREALLECAQSCDETVAEVTGASAQCAAVRVALRAMAAHFRARVTSQ